MESKTSKDENPTPPITNASSSSSAPTKHNFSKISLAHFHADAQLMSEYENSGKSFDYAKSTQQAAQALSSDGNITAYLSKIQRGSLVQSLGCTLVIKSPRNFQIMAHSENCYEILGVTNLVGPALIGTDARNLFTTFSVTTLSKALLCKDSTFPNPVFVRSYTNLKPFYAILHRNDTGIIIDLEPVKNGHPSAIHASEVRSQKLAVRAVSKLKSLRGHSIRNLCEAVVKEVQKITGYDRVMVYKFHEDNHGEVVSEFKRTDLAPYLGLHYSATDIPQVARVLFKQNRIRMICDCNSEPVRVVQNPEIVKPLSLINSTLRAPHACHVEYMINMGSIASLVLAIVVKDNDVDSSTRLWGLVVCHHSESRHIPFPLRSACELVMQAFNLKLQGELQLATQLAEKGILRKQTLLSNMLLHHAPYVIITKYPNIMDFVKCDGAALYYRGKSWCTGVTPNESQVKDIVGWMMTTHKDCTGLSTDCLADAGYPEAVTLGDAVCGMAAARIINSSDFLILFRSHMAKEVKCRGAKHHPEYGGKDDGGKMNPRTSFSAFLEVMKKRSLPWEATEIDAIHSLQLIIRDSIWEIMGGRSRQARHFKREDEVDGLASVAVGKPRLIVGAAVPTFGVDSSGLINEWNASMCELTGMDVFKAYGKSLLDLVHEDSRKAVEALLTKALKGEENKNVEMQLSKCGENMSHSSVYLRINSCTIKNYQNNVVGICFVGQDITAKKMVMDKFFRRRNCLSIIERGNFLIPPIFTSDENAHCSEWNAVIENLTGYKRHEMVGKLLPGEVFGSLCKVKDKDLLTEFSILLYKVIGGQEMPVKLRFGFYNKRGEFVEMHLNVNKKVNEKGLAMGCFCLLQNIKEKKDHMDDNNELVCSSAITIIKDNKDDSPYSASKSTCQTKEGI